MTDRIPGYAPDQADESADLALGIIQKGGEDTAALAMMLHAIHLDLRRIATALEPKPQQVTMPQHITVAYPPRDAAEVNEIIRRYRATGGAA